MKTLLCYFKAIFIIGENRDKSDESKRGGTSCITSPTDGNLQEAAEKRVWLRIEAEMMARDMTKS